MIYLSYATVLFSVILLYVSLFREWEMNSKLKSDKFFMALVWFGMFMSSLSDVLTHFTTK